FLVSCIIVVVFFFFFFFQAEDGIRDLIVTGVQTCALPILKSGAGTNRTRTLRRVRVRFVPAPDFTEAAGRTVITRLRERVGDLEVVLEPVAEMPRTPGGKVRAVVSHVGGARDRKSTRLNSSHDQISYAVFCLKKKK